MTPRLHRRFPPLPPALPRLVCALFAAACLAGGCARRESSAAEPTRLRIAVLSYQAPERLRNRAEPLINHLSSELRIPCDLEIPDSYEKLVDEFAAGRYDLAFFGGYTYVLARQRTGTQPLVTRDVDRHLTSVFLASAKDPRQTLQEFRGARFTFGPRLSTSGHLTARRHLAEQAIEPEKFFREVGYAAGHDQAAFLVQDGAADLSVANAVVIAQMFDRGELRHDAVKIVGETPPYIDYVWAIRRGMPEGFVTRLRDAFLVLSPGNPAHAAILKEFGTGGFLPASRFDFDELAAFAAANHPHPHLPEEKARP